MDGNICASFYSLSFSSTKAITIAIFTECTFYENPIFYPTPKFATKGDSSGGVGLTIISNIFGDL